MEINEDDFFRQATIRICGSLEIEQTMFRCFRYLKDFIPLDEIQLFLFNEDFSGMRSIATADISGGKETGRMIPLPEDVRAQLSDRSIAITKVKIFNRLDLEPLALRIFTILGHSSHLSAILLPLIPDGVRIGTVVMTAPGRDRYSHAHARLLTMLHDPFSLAMSSALKHEEVRKLKDMLVDENQYLAKELLYLQGGTIVGVEGGLRDVMAMVQQVAARESPVLLLGETGVGKELIANAIHYSSPRKSGPFIKVNSGAIPESLIDSELFGHEKGAFTGAEAQKRGRFERAQGGTIFLDEIGDLPLQAQIRLLRVIQHKEFERVGGTDTIHSDVRIIAATHRDLEQMVENAQFRSDLWYRLNVFPIAIPPLKQRKEDIPSLVEYFIKRKAKELNLSRLPHLAPGAIERLIDYPWKGNVRELENVVERALIRYNGGPLNLDRSIVVKPADNSPAPTDASAGIFKLDEIMARHIRSVLETTRGKINGPGGAAELLGVHPNTIRLRMDKLGIPYGRKRR